MFLFEIIIFKLSKNSIMILRKKNNIRLSKKMKFTD